MSLSEKLFYNFSRLFHCSIIKVLAICFRLESLIFPCKTDCFLCFRFVVSLPRQQILSYQIISCLSTLFLTFFILLFKVSVASTSYILSNGSTFVNTFFHIFLIFFKKLILLPYLPIFQISTKKYDNPFPETQNKHHALLLRSAQD